MMDESSPDLIKKIAGVVGHPKLAESIFFSIRSALHSPFVRLDGNGDEWDVFERSLNTAIYDIEADPHQRGDLFKRLLLYGPHDPDDSIVESSDGKTMLSDSECGACIEFIFSHMVNRFQGELGELLALDPCIRLVEQLKKDGKLPENALLYSGNAIQEKNKIAGEWKDFVKGADGLVVCEIQNQAHEPTLDIRAVIEIKSMQRSNIRMLRQIDHHLSRLSGGIKLLGNQYSPQQLILNREEKQKVMVRPSAWKLDRKVDWVKRPDGVTTLVFPEPEPPKNQTSIKEVEPNLWAITLDWSEDALRQSAFEMTYGYMSEVGERVFSEDHMPEGWEGMSPAEAGYNAIKMMLYYAISRIHYYYSKKAHRITLKERKAIHLYNVYSFGYELGADSKYMLWPEGDKPVEMKPEIGKDGEIPEWWKDIVGD
jgi:hypothetical protein